jgi:hypothetical protein
MSKKLLCIIIVLICFVFVSCGSKDITDQEVQNIRDILAGDWKLADDYYNQFEDSEILRNYTYKILDDGTWFYFEDDTGYASDLFEYYIDYAYDDKYSVEFELSYTSRDTLSCIYSEKTDKLFQKVETVFTTGIIDIMERK